MKGKPVDRYLNIISDQGDFAAYVSYPDLTPAPSVVVLHEIFGVNADMRATCDELAAVGFIAICPDLFWRQQPGLDLNRWSKAEWKIGLDLYAAFDRDLGVRDIAQAVQAARALPDANGRAGVMGFCLGGLLAYLTAAREKIDAAVAYHGADTEKYLDEAATIEAPMIMHLAGRDEFISPDVQAAIRTKLGGRPNITIYDYPDNYHAFARHSGDHYDPEAATLAGARTRRFLAHNLGLMPPD